MVIPLSTYCTFFDPRTRPGSFTSASPAHLAACAWATGFFIYDTALCLRYFSVFGFEFLLHAVFCLATYGGCLAAPGGYTMGWYSAGPLLFELSTPFMHLRWWMIQTGNGDKPLFNVFQQLFGYSFLASRKVFGSCYLFPQLIYHLCTKMGQTMPTALRLLFLCNALISIGLNSYWA